VKQNPHLYWLFLLAESAGSIMIFLNAVPIYRRILFRDLFSAVLRGQVLAFRCVAALCGFFYLFCYTVELERLERSLAGPP
jgi:hypothetical protein